MQPQEKLPFRRANRWATKERSSRHKAEKLPRREKDLFLDFKLYWFDIFGSLSVIQVINLLTRLERFKSRHKTLEQSQKSKRATKLHRKRGTHRNYHHLTPRSRGGKNTSSNLLLIRRSRHVAWHQLFGLRNLEEIIKELGHLIGRIRKAPPSLFS